MAGLSRPSTSLFLKRAKTWMPATSAGMTRGANYGRASTPPVSGAGTPVVPGQVKGKPRSERTAR